MTEEKKRLRGLPSKELIPHIQSIIKSFDTKLTVRQIYYQLVSKHLIENVRSQYQRLSKILVKLRHEGIVAWEDIEDRTRRAMGSDTEEETPEEHFGEALSYFKNCWQYYNLPKWKNQPIYLEVWFEKQALEGLFNSVSKKWNITQLACKGYSSHTMGYELARRIHRLAEDKEIHIVYFGDLDPSGIDIYRFIQDMCERFGLNIRFERVAITKEQIKKYDIPPMMAKSSDSRYSGFVADFGTDAVELDALNPDVLKELIENEIKKRFDSKIYDKVQWAERKSRLKIKNMIKER